MIWDEFQIEQLCQVCNWRGTHSCEVYTKYHFPCRSWFGFESHTSAYTQRYNLFYGPTLECKYPRAKASYSAPSLTLHPFDLASYYGLSSFSPLSKGRVHK